MLKANVPKLDPREEHFWVPGPHAGMQLFPRRLSPAQSASTERIVLYVHGGTFPSALSIAHRFDGESWRDVLCDAGFDVWGLDFYGFGASDRYPEMSEPATRIRRSVMLRRRPSRSGRRRASSSTSRRRRGSRSLRIPGEAFRRPALPVRIRRWSIVSCCSVRWRGRPPRRYEKPPGAPAWQVVTLEAQWARFTEDVPADEPPVLSRAHFDAWGERYLDSDPDSRRHEPVGVKIPTGPFNDIIHAWHGDLACDPARVEAPRRDHPRRMGRRDPGRGRALAIRCLHGRAGQARH